MELTAHLLEKKPWWSVLAWCPTFGWARSATVCWTYVNCREMSTDRERKCYYYPSSPSTALKKMFYVFTGQIRPNLGVIFRPGKSFCHPQLLCSEDQGQVPRSPRTLHRFHSWPLSLLWISSGIVIQHHKYSHTCMNIIRAAVVMKGLSLFHTHFSFLEKL